MTAGVTRSVAPGAALAALAFFLVLASGWAAAGEGFMTRLEDVELDGYTITLLDDLHTGSGTVMVFLEVDGAPAPEGTRVSLMLRPLGGEPFELTRADYRGPMFYLERQRALYFAFPAIPEPADIYLLQLFISGPGGQTEISLEATLAPP